jgi:hypothetical protein
LFHSPFLPRRPAAVLLLAGCFQVALAQGQGRTWRGEAAWVDSIPAGSESPVLRRDFAHCLEVLKRMDSDMDLFNLDRIHPHLEELYRDYAEMTGLLPRWDPRNRTTFLADIGKIKDRTEVIHRLFDSGEMEVSQRYLRELIRHMKRLEQRFADQDAAWVRASP